MNNYQLYKTRYNGLLLVRDNRELLYFSKSLGGKTIINYSNVWNNFDKSDIIPIKRNCILKFNDIDIRKVGNNLYIFSGTDNVYYKISQDNIYRKKLYDNFFKNIKKINTIKFHYNQIRVGKYVHIKNDKDRNKFLKICDSEKVKWSNNQYPLDFLPPNSYPYYIELSLDGLVYNPTNIYEYENKLNLEELKLNRE